MSDVSSSVLTWISVFVGLVLVGAAVLDVFLTVLHVQVESPISSWLNRQFWRLLASFTRALPSVARNEILGWGVPMMVSGILVFWTILFIVGFALLYAPFIHDPRVFVFSGSEPGYALDDALYFSAASFITTGYGDITPRNPLVRLLAIMQGGLGLTTLSLSVTYLLSVYPLISRKVSLAEVLNQETGGRADAVVLAERYLKTGRHEVLAQRLSVINDELMRLGQAHGLYPVLYYVRHREAHHAFVRILVIVQGILTTLRYSLSPEAYPEIVTDPRLLLLEEGLLSTLHVLAASSHLAPQRMSAEVAEAARADHQALLAELQQRNLKTVPPDDHVAAARHERFRTATDQYIAAYAANSGYDMATIHAVYSRWDRDTALVGHAELDDSSGETADRQPDVSGGRLTDGESGRGYDLDEPSTSGSPHSRTRRSGSVPVLRNP